ncbi:phosphoadenylyl-sulfate reductase [Myroides odoratimimus]|uniref:Adenosine 5'-phosphosulfate reductase n=1 Tax=Myroides odoratimimus TaxID=76832 RepID=A0AAI8C747_9FLAO|nr:phosphoadenylyl-sulfate reductase [Myroides odoratimimus]ALU27342.1 phosphoadenosine phosphosulfate reductase [Myroides odoratimimus]MCA4807371.1 phosphoadenylyl-sulfate reductase [Myroides odoratimimus]MCS7474536.1 phosphoadenylyl-sulfate reductase [Myroides odoratimimus]MDM1411655.1 phosphoadenylyl-sulfate reductase [Myroides odoratimimus]MDM1461782.1 phosphoadenylyl-sulfate reductase [Myroides odoratimimus]
MSLKNQYEKLLESGVEALSFKEQMNYLKEHFEAITFSTSFSYEDQIITHLLKDEREVSFFTLDTGRLFDQTYDTWSLTLAKYKINITAYFPESSLIAEFVNKNGPDSFYKSVELRKECCTIRKVLPLKKALKNQQIWITGLRAEHSPNRQSLTPFEWDEHNQIIKFHPLLSWSTEEVTAFIEQNQIPYNPLHKQGYISIGCSPCTRAIREGEDFRAGRWWWEDASKKECGLHLKQ